MYWLAMRTHTDTWTLQVFLPLVAPHLLHKDGDSAHLLANQPVMSPQPQCPLISHEFVSSIISETPVLSDCQNVSRLMLNSADVVMQDVGKV